MASEAYRWNFVRLLTELYDGHFISGRYEPSWEDASTCRVILIQLAEYLCSKIAGFPAHLEDVKQARIGLISSFTLDGFSYVGERFIPSESAVINQPEEVSLLKELLKQAAFPKEHVIFKHFQQGEELFVEQKWEPAIGEWRKFFEAVLRDIGEMTSQNRPDVNKRRDSMKEVFEYLRTAGFLDDDERTSVASTYGFLCSGAHPGISEEHKARLAMIQALTFGQVLVSKYITWRECGFRGFNP